MQVADSQRTARYSVQACIGQQGDEVVEIDIAVMMKMIKEAPFPLCWPCKIDGQHPSAGLQNPSHFAGTLLTRFAAQMMKHDCGQYRIESTVWKRQRFDDAILEGNFGASLVGLPTCPGKHLWRCVDSIDCARRTDSPDFSLARSSTFSR